MDSNRAKTPSAPAARSSSIPSEAPESGARFWLEYGVYQVELRPGVITLGRSTLCHVVLDDVLVSRTHAELTTTGTSVTIRDLRSSNGVFVNDRRISEPRVLEPGDRVVIGKQEMFLRATVRRKALTDTQRQRFSADTLLGLEAVPAPNKRPSTGAPPTSSDPVAVLSAAQANVDIESTHQGDALELLGSVADKVLALGRGAEAERVLASCLLSILEAAKVGALPFQIAERAAIYAVKLADATGKSRWIDYSIELFRLLRKPLPATAVDQLYTLLRTISGVNLQGLREYVAVLRSVQRHFGPNERFVAQRIEGLERLAALR